MINVEVATILHFTQVIYQITRHSVFFDIYLWNIVSWQLEHIHSRLNSVSKFHMIVTIKFVCLFTFHETSLTLCNSIQKCTTRLEYSLSGSTRLVNFFGHDQRHVLFVLFGIHQSFYLEFQNISISHCVY